LIPSQEAKPSINELAPTLGQLGIIPSEVCVSFNTWTEKSNIRKGLNLRVIITNAPKDVQTSSSGAYVLKIKGPNLTQIIKDLVPIKRSRIYSCISLREIYILSIFHLSWFKSIKLSDTVVKSDCTRLIGTLRSSHIPLYEGYGYIMEHKSYTKEPLILKKYYRNVLQIRSLSSMSQNHNYKAALKNLTLFKIGCIPLKNRSANREETFIKLKVALKGNSGGVDNGSIDNAKPELNGGILRWKLIKSKSPSTVNHLISSTDICAGNLLILPGSANKELPFFIQEDFSFWSKQQKNLTTILKCPLDLSWYGGTFLNQIISREDLTYFLLPSWAISLKKLNFILPVVPLSVSLI